MEPEKISKNSWVYSLWSTAGENVFSWFFPIAPRECSSRKRSLKFDIFCVMIDPILPSSSLRWWPGSKLPSVTLLSIKTFITLRVRPDFESAYFRELWPKRNVTFGTPITSLFSNTSPLGAGTTFDNFCYKKAWSNIRTYATNSTVQ